MDYIYIYIYTHTYNWVGVRKKTKKALILWPCLDLGLRHPTSFPSRYVLRVWPSCLAQPLGISGLWTSTVHLPLTHYCSGSWVFLSSGHKSLRISSGQLPQCLGLIQVSLVTLGQTAQTHSQEREGVQHFIWTGNWDHSLWVLSFLKMFHLCIYSFCWPRSSLQHAWFSCSIRTLSCGMWDLVPWGIEPGALHWDHGVLVTGSPGESLGAFM